jgi:hypothetical protein
MPPVGFEPSISVLEQTKTVHALDRAATVIGRFLIRNIYYTFLVPVVIFLHPSHRRPPRSNASRPPRLFCLVILQDVYESRKNMPQMYYNRLSLKQNVSMEQPRDTEHLSRHSGHARFAQSEVERTMNHTITSCPWRWCWCSHHRRHSFRPHNTLLTSWSTAHLEKLAITKLAQTSRTHYQNWRFSRAVYCWVCALMFRKQTQTLITFALKMEAKM